MFGNRPANTPALIGLIVALWLGSATVSAQVVTVPTGLNPGDKYRLVFVTDGKRDATSTVMSGEFGYNTFVTTEAATNATLVALGTTWTAIASTKTVNARDNTLTTGGQGVRIYNLSGNLVASNYGDLWDGTITSPINVTQSGVIFASSVWTGTNSNGSSASNTNNELGTTVVPNGGFYPQVRIGWANATNSTWISSTNQNSVAARPLYAMSGELTYSVPEPNSLGLGLVLALAGVAWCNRRRKREQERSTNPAQS